MFKKSLTHSHKVFSVHFSYNMKVFFLICILNSSEINSVHCEREYPNHFFPVDNHLSHSYVLDCFIANLQTSPIHVWVCLWTFYHFHFSILYQHHILIDFYYLQYVFTTGRTKSFMVFCFWISSSVYIRESTCQVALGVLF